MNFENIEFSSIDFESTGHREGIGDEPIQVGIAIMTGFNIDQFLPLLYKAFSRK